MNVLKKDLDVMLYVLNKELNKEANLERKNGLQEIYDKYIGLFHYEKS